MKIVATPIIRTFGFRPVLIGISLGNTGLLAGCALFAPTTPHSYIFLFLLVGGFFARSSLRRSIRSLSPKFRPPSSAAPTRFTI